MASTHAFYAEHVQRTGGNLEPPGPAVLDLLDPTPARARRSVVEAAGSVGLAADALAGLELAVSEVVTNAVVHGRPPVRVRVWLPQPGCVVVTVRDAGPGPRSATVVEHPPSPNGQLGGRGLWIARRSVSELSAATDDDGFVVQLTAGA